MLRLHAFRPLFGVLTFYAASQESDHDGDVRQEGRAAEHEYGFESKNGTPVDLMRSKKKFSSSICSER
jgi:hypothetical protein